MLPFEDNSKFYYVCTPAGIQLAVCTKRSAFDAATGQCEPVAADVPQTRRYSSDPDFVNYNVPECVEAGRFPVPLHPAAYYECVLAQPPRTSRHFVQEIYRCLGDETFHSTKKRCTHSKHSGQVRQRWQTDGIDRDGDVMLSCVFLCVDPVACFR